MELIVIDSYIKIVSIYLFIQKISKSPLPALEIYLFYFSFKFLLK